MSKSREGGSLSRLFGLGKDKTKRGLASENVPVLVHDRDGERAEDWSAPVPRSTAVDRPKVTSARPPSRAELDNMGLVAVGIGKRFKRRQVLRDVSVSVQRGEAVGLLGPNGAGKTTCFYCVTGLINPDAGAIYLDGRDVTGMPMYQRARLGIGYLPQEMSIFRGLTVEQNVRGVLEVVEPNADIRAQELDDLLNEFSISHLRHSSALALSGGERRRAEIARALASRPAFILLDEPLAGIDPIAVGEIRDLVAHLKHRGLGVLITDHNVRETLEIVDRAYILHEGTVMMEGRPSEIVSHEGVRRVYLGDRFSL
jgi:lipopolysaccharide export system ATP-binding protein